MEQFGQRVEILVICFLLGVPSDIAKETKGKREEKEREKEEARIATIKSNVLPDLFSW